MAFHLKGRLLEVCTSGAQCPCQADGEPDEGNCAAVNAWHVERGTIDGTDVAGLTLIALAHVHGHVLRGRPVVYYVDDGPPRPSKPRCCAPEPARQVTRSPMWPA